MIKKGNKRIMITFTKESINNLNKLKEIFKTKQNSVAINKLLTDYFILLMHIRIDEEWEKKKIK